MNGRVDPIVNEELQFQLYDARVFGVSIWRLIRVPVLESIVAKRSGLGRSNHNRVDLKRVPNMVAGILRSIWHLLRLRRREYLIFGFPRRRFENGEWVDPFSDPLIDFLGPKNVICIEKPFGGDHCRPQKTRNIVHYDWLTAATVVLSSVLAVFPWLVFHRKIGRLSRGIRQIGPVSSWRIGYLAGKSIVSFWVERGVSSALLALIRPRSVLLTMRRHHYPLIHACKSRAIAVHELQHGALADGGFKYSTPYDAMLDPDRFLTFGEYWNEFEWGMPPGTVNAIGFKYIADKRSSMTIAGAAGREKIMLVSQPHVWRILEASFGAMIAAFPKVQFILKLHPQDVGRWWERYPSGKARNVQVIDGMIPDLYELFSECGCVCGFDSTVLFEAAYLGIKVGILNPGGDNRCPALQFAGRFNFHEIRNPEQLGELIQQESCSAAGGSSPFFAPFQREQFLRLLQAGA